MTEKTKSAFISIIGRPSSGKSTLVNRLCGQKVSIVSKTPQTTRNSIRGVVTKGLCQLVLVDTPGVHISQKKMNKRLTKTAFGSIGESDVILYLLDSSREAGLEEEAVAGRIAALGEDAVKNKTVACINKIDLKSSQKDKTLSFVKNSLPALPDERIIFISAKEKTNTDVLLDLLCDMADEGPFYYESGCFTDQEVVFRIAEIIREKCFILLREEIPHAVYVDVYDAALKGDELYVSALIKCERESQKGVIIGSGGSMIEQIRKMTMSDLKKIFDWKIRLELRVKTDPNWRQNDKIIKTFV
ncbi:MAG: GTPase Era [Spirochaetaceae bacterium]|jgi:GTP-binding protein Era|nr:GTPase Era [Spirochaetaceae bacterium]